MNQTIKQGLSRTQDQLNWDIYLLAILFSIRTSKATATQQTPFYLVYGREVQDPAEPVQPNLRKRVTEEIAQLYKVCQQAQGFITQAQEWQKKYYDCKADLEPLLIGQ